MPKKDKLIDILENVMCNGKDLNLGNVAAEIGDLVTAECYEKETLESKRIANNIRGFWKNRQNLAEV